ncbi:hypothetical protein WKH31_03710 [Metabacillus indicus]|uniref:hypothetical protein n=1 Tax=Metabacillus indicus TaxID=246786 RepID=UPI00317EEDAD
MTKKLSKFILVTSLTILGFGFLPVEKADAAWSSWKTVSEAGSSCQIRVYTDAATYSSAANTVDAKAETNGRCSTIYYEMSLASNNSSYVTIGNIFTGYFNTATPMKSFNINSVKTKNTTSVHLDVYLDVNRQRYIETVYSSTIVIQPQ